MMRCISTRMSSGHQPHGHSISYMLYAVLAPAAMWFICQTGWAAPPEADNAAPLKTNATGGANLLRMEDALVQALGKNPRLAASTWDSGIAKARRLQAGLLPNPEVSLEVEGIRLGPGPSQRTDSTSLGIGFTERDAAAPGGIPGALARIEPQLSFEREVEQGTGSGFSQAEYSLRITQLVELGGARAKRIHVAEKEIELAAWDYETVRADVIAETARAFITVLAEQRRTAITEESVRLAEKVKRVVDAQVAAGNVSPIESRKAGMEVTLAETEHQHAQGQLAAARIRLASTWGSDTPGFDEAVGDLEAIVPVPPLPGLIDGMRCNPDLARWVSELAHRDAILDAETARRIPALEVSMGLKIEAQREGRSRSYAAGLDGLGMTRTRSHMDRDTDTTVFFEVSLPVPLFDRNQGNIEEARLQAGKTSDERRAVEAEVAAALAAWHALAQSAQDEMTTLHDKALPEARQVFQLTQQGFRQGKLACLDVLDAQRTLVDLMTRLLSACQAHHEAHIELGRLVGAMPDGSEKLAERMKGDEQ